MRILTLLAQAPEYDRLKSQIERAGHTLLSAEDQAQAIYRLQEESCQAMIIDCTMTGENFIKKVREINQDGYIYVFGLVTDDLAPEKDQSINNADEYFHVPVEPDELFARITVVNRHINILSEIRARRGTGEPVRDTITGTFSRTTILEMLNAEVNRTNRTGRSFLLALLSINDADMILETFGDEIFDQALSHVALKIWASVRAYDLIGRWDGQSFMIILLETSRSGASIIAERILKKVNSVPLKLQGNGTLKLGVCMGIIKCGQAELISVSDLIDSAEQALAKALNAGKNRIIYA